MRYCTNCGHKIPADCEFCPNCGAKLSSNKSTERPKKTVTTKAIVQGNPKQSVYHNSYWATLIGWVDVIIDVGSVVLFKIRMSNAPGNRPFHENHVGGFFASLFNFGSTVGNDVDQAGHTIINVPKVESEFSMVFVILAIISGILFLACRKKQSKVLNWVLIGATAIMAVLFLIVYSSFKRDDIL